MINQGQVQVYNGLPQYCHDCVTYHFAGTPYKYQYVQPYWYVDPYWQVPQTLPPVPAVNTGHCRNCGDKLHECKPAKEKK